MADLNSVCLTGRLTRQAEVRYSQNANGGAIVRFSIAVNRRKRSADGNSWEEEPNYFDCVYMGRAAEAVSRFLDKGKQVAVSGELRQSRWEQDGQNRSRVEVFVTNLSLLGSRTDAAPYDGGSSYQGRADMPSAPQQPRMDSASAPRQQAGFQPSNQNRYSGSFSRASSAPQSAGDDYALGPESYGDDDVPF